MNRTTLTVLAATVIAAAGCAAGASSPAFESEGDEPMLVPVAASNIEALAADETFVIDLDLGPVIYELDGVSAPLDIDRIAVMTSTSQNLSLRDYLEEHALELDESNFWLRLASDASLLLDAADGPAVASSRQQLSLGGGIRGGGAMSFKCSWFACTCDGYDDCIDMLGSDVCGGSSSCDDTNSNDPHCSCWRFSVRPYNSVSAAPTATAVAN